MARLSSHEVGGFYEYPPKYLPHVASLFAPAMGGGKLLDPCAGEGDALAHLSDAWGLTPYANELDHDRAAKCVEKFGSVQAVQGDIFQLRASTSGFVGAWINPPYTHDMGSDEKRRELSFLKHSLKWVQTGGYIAWVVYAHHVTADAALVLAKNCSRVDVWQVPELHMGTYTQVVVIGQIGTTPKDQASFAQDILKQGQNPCELSIHDEPLYRFPAPHPVKRFIFAPKVLTPEITLAAIQTNSVHQSAQFQTLLEPPPPIDDIRPIVKPRGMQIGLVLAAGMFNGLILDTPEYGRAAVRSTIRTVEELREAPEQIDEDDPTTTEREVYRTRPVVTITLLTEQGDTIPMTGDAALVNFIHDHKSALLDYLDLHFKPLYNFDYSKIAPIVDRVRLSNSPLYMTQKHVVGAAYEALQERKALYIVGEPGMGKTSIGATLAVTLLSRMRADQVVVVMAPPHLVEKWKREIQRVNSGAYVEILESVDDTRAFMDKAATRLPHTLKVGIIARERAKLSEGWEAAVIWRKRHTALWAKGAPPPDGMAGKPRIFTQDIPICPGCSEVVTKDQKGEKLASRAWLNDAPRTCNACGGALWQDKRTFSAPKDGEKFPRKNPRMALADYLARVHPGRVYLYIADECHELKSLSSDQGEAFAVLCNTAEKVIGLTGTLYGGTASSIYGLEYQLNPRVQRHYNWGEGNRDKGKQLARWVDQMGSLERIVEYKPQYDSSGKYTGKNRVEHQPREAPGTSPMLVREILDHALFVGLTDISDMPAYDEIPVPIDMDEDLRKVYDDTQKALGEYLFQCRMEGDASFLGRYLRTLLSYPNAPFRAEQIIHRRKMRDEAGLTLTMERPVWSVPNLGEGRVFAKEQWLIDTVQSELAEGRKVGIFVEQSATRDIQPRIEQLLREHVPGAKPFILYGKVDPKKREAVLEQQLKTGVNVFIANPKLVQTGLDLVAFPTLIFFEINYSLYVTIQASRRAWRIIQTEPCKTYYPYYTDSMEARAVRLIGRKQRAAKLLYGDNDVGLSELTGGGDDANDLIAELAKSLDADEEVTDLRDLFKAASHEESSCESLWLESPHKAAGAVVEIEPELDPETDVVEEAIDEPNILVENWPQLDPVPLPPPPKRKRRRRVTMSDSPDDIEAAQERKQQHLPAPTLVKQPQQLTLSTSKGSSTMIPEETLQLLRAIYRGQREGYLTLTAIHPDKQQRTLSRHLHIRDKEAIHQSLEDLLRANEQGWGAYFSVALRKEPLGRWKRGGQPDLLALTALYADLDGDLSESFERIRKSGMAGMPSASAMIGSGRGLHLWWLLSEPTDDFRMVNAVLNGLAVTLAGDRMVAHNAMRLPGSHNTKQEVNRGCKLLWLAEDRRYTLDDFAAFAEVQKPPAPPTMKRHRAPPARDRSSAGDFNPDVIRAVEESLIHDWHGFIQPNRWLGSFCPLPHQSDAPGKHFALHPSGKFGVCLGKHRVLKLIDLCRILNIDPAAYGGLYRIYMKGISIWQRRKRPPRRSS